LANGGYVATEFGIDSLERAGKRQMIFSEPAVRLR